MQKCSLGRNVTDVDNSKTMARITTAQDILKEKGYKSAKFDTNGFLEAVAVFFREHEIQSKLLLINRRFVDSKTDEEIEELRKQGEEDYLWRRCYEEALLWRVSDTERARGWKAQFKEEEYEADSYIRARPRIIVDAPYFSNALSLLCIMGGYVVEKKKRAGFYTAEVSLL